MWSAISFAFRGRNASLLGFACGVLLVPFFPQEFLFKYFEEKRFLLIGVEAATSAGIARAEGPAGKILAKASLFATSNRRSICFCSDEETEAVPAKRVRRKGNQHILPRLLFHNIQLYSLIFLFVYSLKQLMNMAASSIDWVL